MWELEYKDDTALNNWCFWTVVLEKTLKSPLDCQEIKPVNPKRNHWILIGRADVEAEAPILWPPDMKSLLIGKIQSKTKLWCWERLKAGGEGGNRGWDDWSRLNGHEFEQTLVMVKDREPGVLQSMESQRVGLKDLATEQQFLISSCFNWLFQWTHLQQHLVELVKRASSLLSFQEN